MANSYGYARVSSADQNEARQIVALTGAGIERGKIFIDHKSGKDFDRPAWRRVRRTLRAGDTLVIQSLDRLGRNYADMLDEWRYLVHKRKANTAKCLKALLEARLRLWFVVEKMTFFW